MTEPSAGRFDFEAHQYSLTKILVVWALVALPMPVLAFFVAPQMADAFGLDPGISIWLLMIAGMIWQFVLAVILLAMEGLPDWRWQTLKQRLWLTAPRHPRTWRFDFGLFWWLVPAFAFYLAVEASPLETMIGELVLIPFPGLADLPELDIGTLAQPDYVGAWWLMGIAIVSCVFNYALGEELLFRGVLLPKMQGAFGKWDWVANSVLFALYHLHRPVQMLAFIIGGLAWTLPSRRYRSIWFALIPHALEGVVLLVGVFAVVSGLAFA